MVSTLEKPEGRTILLDRMVIVPIAGAEPEGPKTKNRSYNQAGLTTLFEAGILKRGDLSGQDENFETVVIDIGTRRQPDIWTMEIDKSSLPQEITV